MGIQAIDHVAVPVQDMPAMLAFYRALGCIRCALAIIASISMRLRFGSQRTSACVGRLQSRVVAISVSFGKVVPRRWRR